jgi:hypothetical protein
MIPPARIHRAASRSAVTRNCVAQDAGRGRHRPRQAGKSIRQKPPRARSSALFLSGRRRHTAQGAG